MQIKAFNLTAQGSSHIKKNKECQDASDSCYCDDYGIAVVCDGHGGDDYIRSAIGSKKACQITLENIKSFISEVDKDYLKRHFDEVLNRLESNIISEWRKQVNEHWNSNPITDIEKAALSEKAQKRYLENHKITSAYGTTLIAVVLTSNYWFCFQIGDGKCVWVNQDSTFEQLPLDKRCFLNATTSLCDSDALEHFQTKFSDKLPAAVFIGSDGVDDCFKNDTQLYNFYKTVCYSFGTNDTNAAQDELKEFLPRLSKKGSGDDISIAAVLNMDILPQLSAVTGFNRDDEKAKKQQAEEIEAKRNEELKQEYEKKAEEARIKREEKARRDQENSINQARKELEDAEKQLIIAKANQDKALMERRSLLEKMQDAAGEALKKCTDIFNRKSSEFTKRDDEYSIAKANFEKRKKRYDEVVSKYGAICPNCKTVSAASDKFCRYCGAELSLSVRDNNSSVQNNQQQECNGKNLNEESLNDNEFVNKKQLVAETKQVEMPKDFVETNEDSLREENMTEVPDFVTPEVIVSDLNSNNNELQKMNSESSEKGNIESYSSCDDRDTTITEVSLQEHINTDSNKVQDETCKDSSNVESTNNSEENNSEQLIDNTISNTKIFRYTHSEYVSDESGEAYSEDHVEIIKQEEP